MKLCCFNKNIKLLLQKRPCDVTIVLHKYHLKFDLANHLNILF